MAVVSLAPPPVLQFFDNRGLPNAGGSVLTQVAGVNTATYQDVAGTIPLPNPIILNSRGEISNAAGISSQLFLIQGVIYTFTLFDALGNQIGMAPYVAGVAINTATSIGYTPPGSVGVVATTAAADLSAGYYNAFRTMTSTQITAVQAGSLAQDVTTAVQNALNNWGEVYFGPGRYPIGLATLTLAQGMKIRGAGKNLTYFVGPASNLTLFTIGTGVSLNEVAIMDATIYWTGAQTTSAGIKVTNGHGIHLHDLRIDGAFVGLDFNGGAAQDAYYADHIELNQNAIGVRTGADGSIVSDLFLDHMVIGQASQYGVLLQNNSGFYLDTIIALACQVGVRFNPITAGQVQAGFCSKVLADTSIGNGWEIVNTGGVSAGVTDITIEDCWASSNGTGLASAATENGVWISATTGPIDGIEFQNMRITNNKGAGVQYDSGNRIQFSDCQVFCNSQVGVAARSGYEIAASVSNWEITGGYSGNGGRLFVVTGVNKQKYGISVAAGSSDSYNIRGVNVDNNQTAGISDLGTGTRKRVSQNTGYNPIGAGAATAITVGASPFTWQNNTGDTVTLIVNGGTVSSITVAGIAVAVATTMSVSVPQSTNVVVTYSSLPTMNYIGH